MSKICYVFPGQGGQAVGMGKDLYDNDKDARAVFDEVDEALGEKLADLIFNGSAEELNKPKNVQVAIFAVSAAMLVANAGAVGFVAPDFVAGHSLGEYAALYAAGCTCLGATAKLLRKRGELMQKAADLAGGGAMAAIIGDIDVAAIAAECPCEIANDNGAGQWVISGNSAAVDKAMEATKARGARLVKQLAVSVPAHSSLMTPIADDFRGALDEVEWKEPTLSKFVSNKTADVMTDAVEIKESLVYQLTHGVRWRESVLNLAKLGAEEIVEIGPGNVLTGLCRRIVPELKCYKLEMQNVRA